MRESRSVKRLIRTFSQSLSAVDLAEPLASLDENQPVSIAAQLMREQNLSVAGVRRAGLVAGWVGGGDLAAGTLGEVMREFGPDDVIAASAGLDAAIGALEMRDQVFVEWLSEVVGVITRRDLQKPPLRMWLFGAITVLDSNLTWAIEELFPGGSWQDRISPGRRDKAAALHAERQRRGSECRLLDCLQIKDKADILVGDRESVLALGLSSRREAERLSSELENLRNHLAHGQELEKEHLATAGRLASVIHSVVRAEGVRRLINVRRGPAAENHTPPFK